MSPQLPSALIWGLLERGIALVYFISFASLATQLLALAGSKGILPIALRLERARRDFPTFRRYFYFPTLLWIDDSDVTLGAIPWLGLIASLAAMAWGSRELLGLFGLLPALPVARPGHFAHVPVGLRPLRGGGSSHSFCRSSFCCRISRR